MVNVKISDVSRYAMTEEDGIKLRNIIIEEIEKDNNVTLDFSNITLFATPFFNSSIGFMYLKLNEEYDKRIFVTNLTTLGETTYQHSIDNAKKSLYGKQSEDDIGEITKKTIEQN